MESTFSVFSQIEPTLDALDFLKKIENAFGIKANLYSVDGPKFPQANISVSKFDALVTNNGIGKAHSIGMYYCEDIRYPDSSLLLSTTIFFCSEKSYLVIGYSKNFFQKLDHVTIWKLILDYAKPFHGFWTTDLRFNPALFATGMYIYQRNAKTIVDKKLYEMERYWILNYWKSKEGLIRDVYLQNILRSYHLNSMTGTDSLTLREMISTNKLGVLKELSDDVFLWEFEHSDEINIAKRYLKNFSLLYFH